MNCQNCHSDRILNVVGKTSDMCYVQFKKTNHYGYVPEDLAIGGEDYIEFDLCLNCGQLQGKFPIPKSKLEIKYNY